MDPPVGQFVLHDLAHGLAAPHVPLWRNTLLLPVYFTAFSIFVFLVQAVLSLKAVQSLAARLFRNPSYEFLQDTEDDVTPPAAPPTGRNGIVSDLKAHIKASGGTTIFVYKAVRLLGCLALVAFAIATAVVLEEQSSSNSLSSFFKKKKHSGKNGNHARQSFSTAEWLQVGLCLVYTYASALAIISIATTRRWSKVANAHLVTLLLGVSTVFIYRDLWPLATYSELPKDSFEGWLLWTKLSILLVTAVLIPILIPRVYVPVDPKNPAAEPHPEQTSSLLSLILFSFLDSLVWKAYRIPHLSRDQLPAMPDYDFASTLRAKGFKHLDTFSGAKQSHLFFGLMKTFREEYIGIAFMAVFRGLASFISPVGINRLLAYIESGGKGAYVRPWFWIIWLFLGPLLSSLIMQWYIFLTTSTLVRCEGLITQLVFEHALRIRVKASVAKVSEDSSSTIAVTPDSISEVGSQSSGDHVTAGNSSDSNEDTVRASSSSVKSSVNKGKGKSSAASVSGKSTRSATSTKSVGESSDGENLVGKLNNLVTTDLSNITEGRDFLLIILLSPVMILVCVGFLYLILGWSALVGMLVMILFFPLPGMVSKVMQTVQIERMKKTDARVQVVTETMNVLRMIKLFGWEPKINAQIAGKREEELVLIKKRQFLDLLIGNLNYAIPLITMIVTFSVYTLVMKQELTASTVFSSMAVFDMLRDQLHMVFYMIPAVIQGKVSLDRVSDFLRKTELIDKYSESTKTKEVERIAQPRDLGNVIGFHDATFAWSQEDDGAVTPSRRKFRLHIQEEVIFRRGCINLIIGPTGSGKTSLLMALLGEMHFMPSGPNSWFNLPREGGIAYAAQESWVQNETIRDNILFGSPYDEERYKKTIYQCGLERDMSLFEAGDLTEVGEKGLTLSGGQKARVTLARAIYSKAETLLLDDVLAALDVHTAKWIVDNCFKGDLVEGRTILLVTHNVAMTSVIAQFVLSLGLDGRVASQGTVSEAIAKGEELQKEIAKENAVIEKSEQEVDSDSAKPEKKPDGKLTVAEEIAEGHVSWSAITLFLSNLGGPVFWVLFLSGILLCDFANVFQTWFLGYWAAQYEKETEVQVPFYLFGFAMIMLTGVVAYCLAYVLYVFGSIKASRKIHKQLMESITGTTLRWLDTTPTGRVIARCTQDIRAVDGPVSQYWGWLCELTITLAMRFGAVVIMSPVFIIPGILVGALGSWCGQIYIKAQLSVKREMSNAKSPVLSHFGAAIAGIVSIRAYGAQSAFKAEIMTRIDRYTLSGRMFYNLNRWVCIRIDALGAIFAASLAAYLVYGRNLNDASNIGFSLNMAMAFSSLILWWVRTLNEFEVSGNSLERIRDYVSIEQEPKSTEAGVPPAYWPASGDLRVENLSAKYSPDGPEVLHDISFSIRSGERIGVVGRTGSGKSSLTLSLLRCIYASGTVYYDSIPTDKINLEALRQNITIIPQVPELLSGTLRTNLDPFSEHDDATLNDALRSAGLFSVQSDDDESRITLDTVISSGGSNLSVGQRQILALARAIVRRSKLLILDEATSAIDFATDTVIQSSLRNELGGDVTLITIAHRLQTIMDSDKILVLDAGRIAEFGSPKELLEQGGWLKSLVDSSGEKEHLYAMANGDSSFKP